MKKEQRFWNVKAIKKYRTAKGLSIIQFAKKMKISRTTAYNYESGDSMPTPARLVKIAKFFGVDPKDLIGE